MGFTCKCTPQVVGLVRQDYPPGKHRANGKAILQECCEERISDSKTLDPERSERNTYWHYDGGVSGEATWDAMCQDADDYRVVVHMKNGEVKERKLREDAPIGWALIAKPPLEMIAALNMGEDDVSRFADDTFAVMNQIEPKLFRKENLTAEAWHRDEDGLHPHMVGFAKDKNGKYCGKLIDPRLFVRIAQQYPALMRARGWPIEDNDLTDWAKYNEKDEDGQPANPEYRAERQAKWNSQGKPVNEYSRQRVQNAGTEAARIITDAQSDAETIRSDAKKEAAEEAAKIKAKAVEEATAESAKKLEALSGAIFEAQLELDDLGEYRRWRAQKRAQEAQDAARGKQDTQDARAAQNAVKASQTAQEVRREQAARAGRAAQAAIPTEEELRQRAEAALQAVPAARVPQAAPERQPEPAPDGPKPGGRMAALRARAERTAAQQKADAGPQAPDF